MLFLYMAMRIFFSAANVGASLTPTAGTPYLEILDNSIAVQSADVALSTMSAEGNVAVSTDSESVQLSTPSVTPELPAAAPAAPTRYQAVLDRSYSGVHQADFASQFDRVRLLVHQAQLEISAKLGLFQYNQGFQYPLLVRFDDSPPPPGAENAVAYVALLQQGDRFEQHVVISLKELSSFPMQFDSVFYHEMTHAVLNDAAGGQAAQRIPRWLQEGLAMYIAGEGEQRVRTAADAFRKSDVGALLYSLDAPASAEAYPQYYLAVKYILDKSSINALQALVRHLTANKPLAEALEDSLGLSPSTFKTNVRDYSLEVFKGHAHPDGFVTPKGRNPMKSRLESGFSK